ncbi:NAD(P)-binding domain-containing protein, partial [Bacillus haynesii]
MSKQEKHNETIAVIGLGFVGLPLAMLLISKGIRVIGVDLDKKKVEALQKGNSYISDINDQAV